MIDIKIIASSSKGNCYLISDGSSPLLIECGVTWRELQRAIGFRTDISAVLVSHSHGDHAKAVKDVLKTGITVCVRQETADELGISGHWVQTIEPMKPFKLGTWNITTFEIIHDVPGLGFCLDNQEGERLVYITDTAYVVPRFNGINYLMVECNYSIDILNRNVDEGIIPVEMKKRLLKTHFSLEHLKGFLRANDLSQVREIHLLHLSGSNSDEARFKREIQAITGKPVYVAKA